MYYSYSKNGLICEICTVFYGDNPAPAHGSKDVWSHKGALFKDIPGKKLRRHERSDDHKDAIRAKTNMKIEESISVVRTEDRSNVNELYITKLIQIFQLLSRNNLPVKFMSQNLLIFLQMRCSNLLLSNTLTHAIKMLLILQVIHVTLFCKQLTNFTAMMQTLE